MPVKGKKKYNHYLTPKYYEAVSNIIEKGKYEGGMSGYFDGILKNTYETLVESGAMKKAPLTPAKVFKIFINGILKD